MEKDDTVIRIEAARRGDHEAFGVLAERPVSGPVRALRPLWARPAAEMVAACTVVTLATVLLFWRSDRPRSFAEEDAETVGRADPGPFDAEPPAMLRSFSVGPGGQLIRYTGRTSLRYRMVAPDVYELTVDAFPVPPAEN